MRPGHTLLTLALACSLPAWTGCGSAAPGAPDEAQVLHVTTLSDDGSGSLRNALTLAVGGDTVRFDPALSGTLVLSAPLEIHGDLTIEGVASLGGFGAPQIIVRPEVGLAAFEVRPGADVVIRTLQFQGPGGAVLLIRGRVRMDHVVIEQVTTNSAVENRGGILEITECEFRDCHPPTAGGALRISGGVTQVRRCAFHRNSGVGSGGAIEHAGGVLSLVNCTLHDNEATPTAIPSRGGAVRSADSAGGLAELNLIHCTVTANRADEAGGLSLAYPIGGNAFLRGSIIAENVGLPVDLDAGQAPFLQAFFNVVGVGTGAPIADGSDGNIVGTLGAPVETILGSLLDLGGVTPSRQPLLGSPALGRVPPAECIDVDGSPLTRDQRGFQRPVNGDCESGAFER